MTAGLVEKLRLCHNVSVMLLACPASSMTQRKALATSGRSDRAHSPAALVLFCVKARDISTNLGGLW